ncbi:MAG: virulence RhuM family protein [Proteobacteria bacterium]|nr:virulence RhuM family protein [Desulfocapsa sp.]MBU3946330.1 virulence RhuM family protein [Pseudomonadota bacterium]MBU4029019.1 virulence RhuM family protein [Pseudomonadota bacterium]MBU4043074.1 virulence RhuM family protein [Pseudomonadota bacterium]MBU4085261.1 virulence RhuM family protein [Pseudomonadota bacterium]
MKWPCYFFYSGLNEEELLALNNLVEQYLVFAEGQAMRRIAMHMSDWLTKLDGFLSLNDSDILEHAGKISHQIAKELAETEYDRFHTNRLQLEAKQADEEDFEQLTRQVEDKGKEREA